jgi:hypothetical protein
VLVWQWNGAPGVSFGNKGQSRKIAGEGVEDSFPRNVLCK